MKEMSIAALWLPTFLMVCSPTAPKIETATSTNGADLLGAFHQRARASGNAYSLMW
jgi:hypothetical protein